ncbi:coiled-coil domain-containing protein 81 [Melanerpes formicivorus]|uniref:coiled-coil domain-containing protein 81 n=1 Tax=Melanerpes formicivorus TaxID=211600 RepID=UPI00358DFAA9
MAFWDGMEPIFMTPNITTEGEVGDSLHLPHTMAQWVLEGWEPADMECDLVLLCSPERTAIWEAVAGCVQQQLLLHKGVRVPTLGSFEAVPRQILVGGKFVTLQRPTFHLARNLVCAHSLMDNKELLPGNKELEPLKYSEVAATASVSRQKVEGCVEGTMSLLSHCLGKGENVALKLRDIGVLVIEDTKVQMKFYFDFLGRISGKENLEKAFFKVPQLLDMVVSPGVPVATLSSSGRVIIFPEFEMEFVSEALFKTWRQVPGRCPVSFLADPSSAADEIPLLQTFTGPKKRKRSRVRQWLVTPEDSFAMKHPETGQRDAVLSAANSEASLLQEPPEVVATTQSQLAKSMTHQTEWQT